MLNKSSVNFSSSVYRPKLITKMKEDGKKIRKVNTDKLLTREELTALRLIGQFDKKFIIAYNHSNNNIVIFDQHAIHERILYEYYTILLKTELTIDEVADDGTSLSRLNLFKDILGKYYLKEAVVVNVDTSDSVLDMRRLNSLFNFDFIGVNGGVKLLTVPVLFDKILDIGTYVDMFTLLLDNVGIIFDDEFSIKNINIVIDVFLNVIKTRACKDAVKFNDELDDEFQIDLIKNLKTCMNPFLCAHGRHNFFVLYKAE
jgi:DNA mismatch repair ATPase MutL